MIIPACEISVYPTSFDVIVCGAAPLARARRITLLPGASANTQS